MLDFIKKFFKKPEPEAIPEITIADAVSRIERELDEEKNRIKKLISDQKSEIERTKTTVMEKLDDLEKAELRNPKITTKEIQFMKGNRDSYLRQTRYFINSISNLPDEEAKLKEYSEKFSERLARMRKSTQRNTMVLNDFFKNETGALAHSINALSKQISSLSSMHRKSKLTNIGELMNQMESLSKKIKNISNIKKEKDAARKLVHSTKQKVDEIILDIGKHSKTESMQELKILRKSQEDKEGEIRRLTAGVKEKFAILDRALRKYEHIAMDSDTCNRLLDDPVKCAFEHTEKTIKLLETLDETIKKKGLGLKDKKRDKTTYSIKYLVLKLNDLKETHKQLEKELEDIRKKKNSHHALKKEKQLQEELERAEVEHKRAKKKLDLIDDPLTDSQVEGMLRILEGEFEKVFEKVKLKR